ncbi:sulfotransferase family protein [Nocardia donostiensis]|uniref:Sulfotransferase family protein n=1 Tax=Nocardia donostiensis TaxID=1538463 RepID=A0A1V2THH4_9NOCA|nr:sulfotransferase [Nocardia donostiensis]ONM48934.1 sulfotransferase family protein [Nocardia donostiensis]OQS15446.1 sulfotransferase family protein [Nocardia donostiensis]OQS22811.1 sulfotransferase family protein [Nocardia donostiensis]
MIGRDDVGTIDDLHASATKVVGLDDFGDDDYRTGLAVLLESYEKDAELTPFGNKVNRAFLRGALIARLLSESAWKQHPEHADVPITRPIFVTGLPRSGTTAVHRLLTADPAHQGLEMWLTEMPQPRPPRDTWADNPVFQRLQAGYEKHHVEHPEFMGVHHISADQVEECWQLLRQSAMSISYECLGYLPRYSEWLREQDWTGAYRRHRHNLQLIGLNDRDRRWVLKNPSHLFALDALLAVYPDALVIQMHRAPSTIIASVCSLNEQASAGWSDKFRGPVVGRAQLDLWSRGARTFLADRRRHDQAQFCDVYYNDFVADPIGTVESIYRHFDLPFTEDTRTAMTALHSESASGAARPAHRYTLEDFGLTTEEVNAEFDPYLDVYFPGGR